MLTSQEFGAPYKDTIRTWLGEEMSSRRWSTKELAHRTDLSARQLRDLLNGKRKTVRWRFCVAVANSWYISEQEVLCQAGLMPRPTPLIEQISKVVKTLSEEDQTHLLYLVKLPFSTEPLPTEPGWGFTEWVERQIAMRSWSRKGVAEKLGMSHTAISYILDKSANTPKRTFCIKLAQVFKIPPTEVFYAAGLLPLKYRNTHSRLIARLFLVEERRQQFLLRKAEALAKTSRGWR